VANPHPPPSTSAGDKKYKGTISLEGVRLLYEGDSSILGSRPNIFTIATPRKAYHIQAANESEKASWLAALSHNMAICGRVEPANRRDLLKCVSCRVATTHCNHQALCLRARDAVVGHPTGTQAACTPRVSDCKCVVCVG
jgi:hypothetical protein